MIVHFHPRFDKQAAKLPKSVRRQLRERLRLFRTHPTDARLNRHRLKGKYLGCLSINVTGDVRAVYQILNREEVRFTHVGSHSQLYR
ncbi:type II toxin-antitoxin system mRNA interferase toxin, RelE/StbE family [Candidatus Berkelbacteria bacterium]|nr:type II toxin-antitoxin system mRNA interferase toxin, RelE/StbE family [Candidatus Berkelbacteria bacterium]